MHDFGLRRHAIEKIVESEHPAAQFENAVHGVRGADHGIGIFIQIFCLPFDRVQRFYVDRIGIGKGIIFHVFKTRVFEGRIYDIPVYSRKFARNAPFVHVRRIVDLAVQTLFGREDIPHPARVDIVFAQNALVDGGGRRKGQALVLVIPVKAQKVFHFGDHRAVRRRERAPAEIHGYLLRRAVRNRV